MRIYTEQSLLWLSKETSRTCPSKTGTEKRSSYKEHTEDALVHGAEEGRDKLRKAAGRSKYPEIRRYPNEGTQRG